MIYLIKQNPKALTTLALGLILYFVKPFIPELFSPELTSALETIIGTILAWLVIHYSRLNKSEIQQLNGNNYNHLTKGDI